MATPPPSWPPTMGKSPFLTGSPVPASEPMSLERRCSSEWHRPAASHLTNTSCRLGGSRSISSIRQSCSRPHSTAACVFIVPHPLGNRQPAALRRGLAPRLTIRQLSVTVRHESKGRFSVTIQSTTDVYYDPYDVGIDADPYPVFRRMREEAPLYYNEPHDFYAVSRFADVERGLLDPKTFISGRGGIIELIRAKIEMPSGVLIFEDPPVHTIHRRLMSRVFSSNRVAALEPQIREFCARSLDPLVGAKEFDFVTDLGTQMPMRVIGMPLAAPPPGQGG